LKPIIVDAKGLIEDGDSVVFINYRSDRMREIVQAVGIKPPFETELHRKDLMVVQMTQYDSKYKLPILFPPQDNKNVLAEWISKQGKKQFHTAETEKYAHVTFFFNGGTEEAFPNEDRKLIASPKVATYDLKPEMSVSEVGESVVSAIDSGKYDFVMCNLAPPDMVGHTGVYDKTVIAVEATDKVIGKIWAQCQKAGYVLVVTADHGNAEEMFESDGSPKTAHTTNLVPLIIASTQKIGEWNDDVTSKKRETGLADVAPTILDIMGLSIPKEMTGKSLVSVRKSKL